MTIAALLALAERVEREAPSNQLDAEVWDTIGLTDDQKRHCQKWVRMDGRTDLTRFDFLRAWTKYYTSSIDAAASLMPDVWETIVCGVNDHWSCAAQTKHSRVSGSASTEPQARLAAALRARAATIGDDT